MTSEHWEGRRGVGDGGEKKEGGGEGEEREEERERRGERKERGGWRREYRKEGKEEEGCHVVHFKENNAFLNIPHMTMYWNVGITSSLSIFTYK